MLDRQELHSSSLAGALRAHVLLHDPGLLNLYRDASPRARRAVQHALEDVARRILLRAGDPHGSLGRYLAPLIADEAGGADWHSLAKLLAPVHDDLAGLVRETLFRHHPSDLTTSGTLQISLAPTSYACAQYLAGLLRLWPAPNTPFELPRPQGRWIRSPDSVHVTVRTGSPHGMETQALRAKTLLLLLSVTITTPQNEGHSGWYVRFADMLRVFGYAAGERANSRYYWQHFSQIARSALIELPAHHVHLDGGRAVPLLEILQVVHRDPRNADASRTMRVLREAQATPEAVQALGLLGVRFRFTQEVLKLLRACDDPRGSAAARVPVGFCTLDGPSFWLAWRIAYWAAWNGRCPQPFDSPALLEVLRESGYLAASGVRRYKRAVRRWWQDVGTLVDLGLLQEPGVRLHRRSGGRLHDCSDHFSRLLDDSSVRLSEAYLRNIRVRFVCFEN